MQDEVKANAFVISELEGQLRKERDCCQALEVAKKEATRQATVSSIFIIWPITTLQYSSPYPALPPAALLLLDLQSPIPKNVLTNACPLPAFSLPWPSGPPPPPLPPHPCHGSGRSSRSFVNPFCPSCPLTHPPPPLTCPLLSIRTKSVTSVPS